MKGQCGFVYDWGKKNKQKKQNKKPQRPKNTCIGLVYLQELEYFNVSNDPKFYFLHHNKMQQK